MPKIIIGISRSEFADAVADSLRPDETDSPEDVSIGITGTRDNLTDPQKHALGILVTTFLRVTPRLKAIHHGCAVGTDEYSHQIAVTVPGSQIFGHPGHGHGRRNPSPYQMKIERDTFYKLYDSKPYRERNLDIVRASGILLACPQYPENDTRSIRSGTWQTIRYARRTLPPIPILLIIPNGAIVHHHTEGH